MSGQPGRSGRKPTQAKEGLAFEEGVTRHQKEKFKALQPVNPSKVIPTGLYDLSVHMEFSDVFELLSSQLAELELTQASDAHMVENLARRYYRLRWLLLKQQEDPEYKEGQRHINHIIDGVEAEIRKALAECGMAPRQRIGQPKEQAKKTDDAVGVLVGQLGIH